MDELNTSDDEIEWLSVKSSGRFELLFNLTITVASFALLIGVQFVEKSVDWLENQTVLEIFPFWSAIMTYIFWKRRQVVRNGRIGIGKGFVVLDDGFGRNEAVPTSDLLFSNTIFAHKNTAIMFANLDYSNLYFPDAIKPLFLELNPENKLSAFEMRRHLKTIDHPIFAGEKTVVILAVIFFVISSVWIFRDCF